MDDGGKVSSGMKLATNSLKFTEVENLSYILNQKYQLSTSIISAGVPNQYNIYIPKKSMNKLIDIVGIYIHPSMKYKLEK